MVVFGTRMDEQNQRRLCKVFLCHTSVVYDGTVWEYKLQVHLDADESGAKLLAHGPATFGLVHARINYDMCNHTKPKVKSLV